MKLETYLTYAPLFSGITAEESHKLLDCLMTDKIQFKKNAAIVTAGEKQLAVGLLLRGKAHAFLRTWDGEEKFSSILTTGDCFGLENAFPADGSGWGDGAQWAVSVVAVKDSQVMFFNTERCVAPCQKNCKFHRTFLNNLNRVTAKALYRQTQRAALLTVKSMRGRITGFLLQCAQEEKEDPTALTLPYNRNQMAAYLDVSRPSMSRELARMKEEGIIDYYLDTVQILDMDKLTGRLDGQDE